MQIKRADGHSGMDKEGHYDVEIKGWMQRACTINELQIKRSELLLWLTALQGARAL